MGLDNPIHIAVVLFVLLLVFGAKRLPEMGRSLGSGMRGFKDSLTGVNPMNELSMESQSAPAESTTSATANADTHVPVS